MKNKYIDHVLAEIIKKLLEKYKIQDKILTVIINSAINNNTMFINILKHLKSNLKYSNLYYENKKKNCNDEKESKVRVVHVSCLTHVLQLTLKTLLNNVRINSTNNEFQKD